MCLYMVWIIWRNKVSKALILVIMLRNVRHCSMDPSTSNQSSADLPAWLKARLKELYEQDVHYEATSYRPVNTYLHTFFPTLEEIFN